MYIEDLSGNGTWVDEDKIGQGNMRVLSNNSVIALAEQKHQGINMFQVLWVCDIVEFLFWDELSLGWLVFECFFVLPVFMFIDKMGNDQPNLPAEFSNKYHIARKIGT